MPCFRLFLTEKRVSFFVHQNLKSVSVLGLTPVPNNTRQSKHFYIYDATKFQVGIYDENMQRVEKRI